MDQFPELHVDILAAIQTALKEDIGPGDATTEGIVPPDATMRGRILAKQAGIVAGLDVARAVFLAVDERVTFTPLAAEGDRVENCQTLAELSGPARALLTGERTALNFLGRMSGIATLTRQFVDAVAGTKAVILDTRKTAPGLRLLDKWAVRLGGGHNHRVGLYDMVLIKDNHIAAAGGITAAVERVRAQNAPGLPIEVEVKTWAELEEAVALRPDRIMLDNMSPAEMRRAADWVAGRVPLEASGGIDLDTVRAVAETGVDYISVGALTHSVMALDISLEVEATT
jgi:nicotinate-nucleotide pyrophosphorylase (carboxylating)